MGMTTERHSRRLQLYLRHRTALIDYAVPIVGDRTLAEDVVQDAWVRFSEADAGAQLILRPVGYLYRIVRNLALDNVRRRRGERGGDGAELPALPDPAPGADRGIEGREMLGALQDALAELPERTRTAFEMNRVRGMTYAQIGAALDISQTRAYELVRAALAHCMTRMMDDGHL